MHQYRPAIEAKIDELATLGQQHKAMILTEDDLKVHLVRLLYNIQGLGQYCDAWEAGISGTKIHTELSWFDRNGKLSIKPDITILEPANLKILRGIAAARLPSKQYNFTGQTIIFELKFCRLKGGISEEFAGQIEDDINKIHALLCRLQSEGSGDQIFSYVVVFSKAGDPSNRLEPILAQFEADTRIKVIYKDLGVRWQ